MKNLLILGMGQYGIVAKEVAEESGQFEKIAFLDDNNPDAAGKLSEGGKFIREYTQAFAAVGNPELRAALLKRAGGHRVCNCDVGQSEGICEPVGGNRERMYRRTHGCGECRGEAENGRICLRGKRRQSQCGSGRHVSDRLQCDGRRSGKSSGRNKSRKRRSVSRRRDSRAETGRRIYV